MIENFWNEYKVTFAILTFFNLQFPDLDQWLKI